MDWTKTLIEVIDLGSFSSLWYWIVLAVVWSSASHWVLGVPYDMLLRARRQGGQAQADLEDIVRVNVTRMLYVVRESGLWVAGFLGFFHGAMIWASVWFRWEFAQALEFIALPMTLVGWLSFRTALRIESVGEGGQTLDRMLIRHRFWTQVIGMIAIFCTATYGMYRLLYVPSIWVN